MTRLTIAAPENAANFVPVSSSINRITKEGTVPVVNMLVGTSFLTDIGGLMSLTSTGPIANDTVTINSSKLEIAGNSTSLGVVATKEAAFTSFMYFFPKTFIIGHSEIQDDAVGSGPVPIQRMRWDFEDLASADHLIVDLQGGNTNAQVVLRQTKGGTTTDLVTIELPAGIKQISWEFRFVDEGVSKFFYMKQGDSEKTRAWSGTITADIAECKLTAKLMIDQTTTKTVKSDFLTIAYPAAFVGYDVTYNDRFTGQLKIWDQNGTETESSWLRVYSKDHKFIGDRIIENGLIRARFYSTNPPKIVIYGYDGTAAWSNIGEVHPLSSSQFAATSLQGFVITQLDSQQVRISVHYGICDYDVIFNRGAPYMYVASNSKFVKVKTSKQRMALPVKDQTTELPDWNAKNSDDVNRGNPLNLVVPTNPYTFTNDTNINTGLQRINDNWTAFYNITATDVVLWLGYLLAPTSFVATATSSTVMDNVVIGFPNQTSWTVGILASFPTTVISGVPLPLHPGNVDEYVKWRSNESLYQFTQRQSVRRRR